jgi:hypothetical protein
MLLFTACRSMRAPRTVPVRDSAGEQSCYVGLYDQYWPNDYVFKDRYRLLDYGDVLSFPGRTEDMVAAVEATMSKLVESNAASLGLGGDHLTSYPALRAHAKKHGPLSLIHFDAHTDLTEAPHLFHGSMFGVAVQEGLIDPDASIHIGIRIFLPPGPKLHVLTADRCLRMDGKAIADRIVEVIGTRKCYITLDVDAMDPAYTGGTGTPAPGGLTSALQREILWHLKGVTLSAAMSSRYRHHTMKLPRPRSWARPLRWTSCIFWGKQETPARDSVRSDIVCRPSPAKYSRNAMPILKPHARRQNRCLRSVGTGFKPVLSRRTLCLIFAQDNISRAAVACSVEGGFETRPTSIDRYGVKDAGTATREPPGLGRPGRRRRAMLRRQRIPARHVGGHQRALRCRHARPLRHVDP